MQIESGADQVDFQDTIEDCDVIVLSKQPLLPLCGRKREHSQVIRSADEIIHEESTARCTKRRKVEENLVDPEQDNFSELKSNQVDSKQSASTELNESDWSKTGESSGAINQSESDIGQKENAQNDSVEEPTTKKRKPKKTVVFAEDLEQVKFFMATDKPNDPSLTIEQVKAVQKVIDDNSYGNGAPMPSYISGASQAAKKDMHRVRMRIEKERAQMADESNTTRLNEAMKPIVRFSFYALPRGKFTKTIIKSNG